MYVLHHARGPERIKVLDDPTRGRDPLHSAFDSLGAGFGGFGFGAPAFMAVSFHSPCSWGAPERVIVSESSIKLAPF